MELIMGIPTILCLIFIALKLIHFIDWPWLWVFSPLIVNMALYIIGFIVFIFKYNRRRW
jgi:hypothetical protein